MVGGRRSAVLGEGSALTVRLPLSEKVPEKERLSEKN
jgi:hypothetical protein